MGRTKRTEPIEFMKKREKEKKLRLKRFLECNAQLRKRRKPELIWAWDEGRRRQTFLKVYDADDPYCMAEHAEYIERRKYEKEKGYPHGYIDNDPYCRCHSSARFEVNDAEYYDEAARRPHINTANLRWARRHDKPQTDGDDGDMFNTESKPILTVEDSTLKIGKRCWIAMPTATTWRTLTLGSGTENAFEDSRRSGWKSGRTSSPRRTGRS